MRRYSFRGLVRASHFSRMTWVVCAIVLIFASYSTIGHGGATAFAYTTSTAFFVDSTTVLRKYNGHRYHHPRTKASEALRASSVQQDALSSTQPGLPLPPMDETFSSPIAALREQLSAPSLPANSARYDVIGLKTGGIWRTKRYGMVPCTLVAAQVMTPWLAKEEAVGNVFSAWPQSVVELFGQKSLLTLGVEPNVHAAVRRVFNDPLSPRAVAKLAPFMESCLKRHVCRWDEIASSGKMVRMFDDISSFTMEVIAYCFLGDYGTGEVLEKLQWIVPAVADGLISKPRRFPWPLNRMPGHKYGTAIDARKEFDAVVGGVVRQRRLDLAAEVHGKDGARRKAGVLDAMLQMQAKQVEEGGPTNEEMEYDDVFILDNMCNALFAGYDTTSVTMSRMLQFLASDDSKNQGLVEKLLEEFITAETVLKEILGSSEQEGAVLTDIMQNFPLLHAVMLESNRLSPAVSSAFRVARTDLEFNGFLVPKGEKICWNLNNGNKAESLYPEPAKFCPFRFLHGSDDQPRPSMFGFGRHNCPGRELAKLEIVMFFETFLRKYKYRLAKKQNFHGKLPVNAPKGGMKMVLAHGYR